MSVKITLMTDEKLDAWLDANEEARGRDHVHRLIRLWQEMQESKRLIWAAWEAVENEEDVVDKSHFLGHITLQATSHYPPFKKQHIPEIVDVWVQPQARRRHIGQALLQKAVETARKGNAPGVGMGVGLTKNYGAAHIMYSKHGFMPDGSGMWIGGSQAGEMETLTMGPDAILMWVKYFG